MRRVACSVLLPLVAAACDRAPPFWTRASFAADVTLRGRGATWRGRVTFHRPIGEGTGTLQIDSRADGAADNATLLPSGATSAFRDGVPRPIRPDEQATLDALASLFGWPGRTCAARAGGDRQARFRPDAGAEYTLDVVAEVATTSPHPK